MENKRILIISEKETFLVRVMVQKTKEAGFDCEYVPLVPELISAKWKGISLVTLYMEEGATPGKEVLRMIVDKLNEDAVKIILVGTQSDVNHVADNVPGDLIYKVFYRPIDNVKYTEAISELFRKIDSGEFRKSIMIVDDDPSYLGLVREWLKGTYKVSMANSGLQAIKMLGQHKVDLILLDHEMPVTSGPQVLEMLRSDSETKNIPVMFLTGKGDKESVMSVLALRPEGYFLKNIKKEELLENLREFFILHK